MELPFCLCDEKIKIYSDDGITVVAQYNDGITTKKAVAICTHGDVFDFLVGAEKAMNRLLQELRFKPYLRWEYTKNGKKYFERAGIIGTAPSKYLDKNGKQLYVGDVIIYNNEREIEVLPLGYHNNKPCVFLGCGLKATIDTSKCQKIIGYEELLHNNLIVQTCSALIRYITKNDIDFWREVRNGRTEH